MTTASCLRLLLESQMLSECVILLRSFFKAANFILDVDLLLGLLLAMEFFQNEPQKYRHRQHQFISLAWLLNVVLIELAHEVLEQLLVLVEKDLGHFERSLGAHEHLADIHVCFLPVLRRRELDVELALS